VSDQLDRSGDGLRLADSGETGGIAYKTPGMVPPGLIGSLKSREIGLEANDDAQTVLLSAKTQNFLFAAFTTAGRAFARQITRESATASAVKLL